MGNKTAHKPTQHELDVAALKDTKLKLLDLIAERDALAVRVLELENAPHEVVKLVTHPDPQTLARLGRHEAFLRNALKTATFDSTAATALLEP